MVFHVSYGLLEKKKYSTENKITIRFKMLLCQGLVLLTTVNFRPRFPSRQPHGFVLFLRWAFLRSALAVYACQCAYGFRRYCNNTVCFFNKNFLLRENSNATVASKGHTLFPLLSFHLRLSCNLLLSCDFPATLLRLICNFPATCLQLICDVPATFLRLGCYLLATFL